MAPHGEPPDTRAEQGEGHPEEGHGPKPGDRRHERAPDHAHHADHHAHASHDHEHHAHLHAPGSARDLGLAFFFSFGVLAVLLVGGAWSGSLALLADAGHVVTDIAALGLSWYATWQATRPANRRRTFGYHRTGILAALANAVSLLLIACWIAWEAYHRLQSPHPVVPGVMMAAAALGLVINLGIGLKLHGHAHGNLNVRSAYMHVIGDAAASAGVVAGAGLIWATGWQPIDPLLSVAIAALIAWGAWEIVDESVEILMEGAPRHLDADRIASDLAAVDGVAEVHDLHLWSIARDLPCLSCHVLIADADVPRGLAIVAACNRVLAEGHGITHTTIQAEAAHCSPDTPGCNLAFVQPANHGHSDPPCGA